MRIGISEDNSGLDGVELGVVGGLVGLLDVAGIGGDGDAGEDAQDRDDDDQLNESKPGLGTKLFHRSFLPFFVLRRILYHRHAARAPISHTRGHGLDIRIYRYLSKALVMLIIGR